VGSGLQQWAPGLSCGPWPQLWAHGLSGGPRASALGPQASAVGFGLQQWALAIIYVEDPTVTFTL